MISSVAFLSHAPATVSWVWRASIEASLLAGLVVAAQFVLRGRVSARWRYNLWLLVILRLVLPVFPQSRLSPFNWMHAPAVADRIGQPSTTGSIDLQTTSRPIPMPVARPQQRDLQSAVQLTVDDAPRTVDSIDARPASYSTQPKILFPADDAGSTGSMAGDGGMTGIRVVDLNRKPVELSTSVTDNRSSTFVMARPSDPAARMPLANRTGFPKTLVHQPINWIYLAFIAWSLIALLLVCRALLASVRLWWMTRRFPLIDDGAAVELFRSCGTAARVRRLPRLLQSSANVGPALVGVWRPVLLVPGRVLKTLSPSELRLVLLHELVHLRRRDVAMNWLLSALSALHWFNPLIWWAFARMRADRELACDEAVLSLGTRELPHARQDYGRAMIKLLETFAGGASPPVAVGVLDGSGKMRGALMRRRISMIAEFKKPKGWSLAGMTLSAALAAVAVTGAVRGQVPGDAPPPVQDDPNNIHPGRAYPAHTPPGNGLGGSRPGMRGTAVPPGAMPGPSNGVPGMPGRGAGMMGGYGGGLMPPAATGTQNPGASALPGGGGVGGAAPGKERPTDFSSFVEGPEAARADARTADRLHTPLTASFDNIPLREALNYIVDKTGVDFFLDSKAFEDAGIAPDQSVSLQIKGAIPADEVLRLALRSAGGEQLAYGIFHGVVHVTTRASLEATRVTRAYDIRDFQNQADQLMTVVRRTVAPNTWDTNGGNASLLSLGSKMIVTTSEPSQHEIAKLLALLRDEEKGPRAAVDATEKPLTADNPTALDLSVEQAKQWLAGAAQRLERAASVHPSDAQARSMLEEARGMLRRTESQILAAEQVQDELKEKAAQFGPNHPMIRQLQNRLQSSMEKIRSSIDDLKAVESKTEPMTFNAGSQNALSKSDAANLVVIHLQNTDVSQAPNLLKQALSDWPASATLPMVSIDVRTNSLVISGPPQTVEKVKAIVEKLDVPQKPGAAEETTLHLHNGPTLKVPKDLVDEISRLWQTYEDKIYRIDDKDQNRREVAAQFNDDVTKRIKQRDLAQQPASVQLQAAIQERTAHLKARTDDESKLSNLLPKYGEGHPEIESLRQAILHEQNVLHELDQKIRELNSNISGQSASNPKE